MATRKLATKGESSIAEKREAMLKKLSPDLSSSSTPPGEAPIRDLLPRVIIDGASGMSQAKFFNRDTEETVSELGCTILAVRWHRSWYKEEFSDEGGAPSCVSSDSKRGFARSHEDVETYGVGGECAKCPMRGRDRGQCQQRAAIFAVSEDFDSDIFMVDLPPTSVFPLQRYLQTREMKGYSHPFMYHTKIGFVQKKSGEYTTWRIDPQAGDDLSDTDLVSAMTQLESIGPMLKNVDQLSGRGESLIEAEVSSAFDDDLEFA